MVRSDRNYPDVYFGRPGALVKLPYPRGGIERSYQRTSYDFETATGQHIVSQVALGARQYGVSWNALHMDNYRLIEQYYTGMMGQGPWAIIDPATANLLMPNQASATSLFNDTRLFSATAGTLISNSNLTHIHRTGAPRSLRWLFSTAPGATSPTLSVSTPYRSWYGFPAIPGQSYTMSSWLKPDGVVDTNVTMALKISWLDSTGTQITQITSGDITATGWQQYSCGGVAPAGTAYLRPTWVLTGSTMLVNGSVYLDELMVEQDSVINAWAPGTGIRPVEILGLNDSSPFNARFRVNPVMTLRELAP
jgi:hypothetical protein